MKQDKWIERVLKSTDDMQRAEPPEELYARIRSRIAAGVRKDALLRPMRWNDWRTIAAGILLAVNLGILGQRLTREPAASQTATTETTYSPITYNLYDE